VLNTNDYDNSVSGKKQEKVWNIVKSSFMISKTSGEQVKNSALLLLKLHPCTTAGDFSMQSKLEKKVQEFQFSPSLMSRRLLSLHFIKATASNVL